MKRGSSRSERRRGAKHPPHTPAGASPTSSAWPQRAITVGAIALSLVLVSLLVGLPSWGEPERPGRASSDRKLPEVSGSATTAAPALNPAAETPQPQDAAWLASAAAGSRLQLPSQGIAIDTEPQQKQLLQTVERAVETYPERADILHIAGLTYGELLRTERAVELFQRSLQADPRNADVLVAYADMLLKSGKQQQAAEALDKAIEEGVETAEVRANLGEALMQLGDIQQSATVLQRGAELYPQSPNVRLRLAQAQVQLGQFDEAEQNARLAIELGEKSRAVYVALTAALVRLGKREEALALRQEMPPLEQTTTDDQRYQQSFREFASHTYALLGIAYDRMGETAQAEQWLLHSLEFEPAASKSLTALADVYHRSERLADALQVYERLVQADPSNLMNYSNYASVAISLGDVPAAEEALRQAAQVDRSGYADLYLARFQFELGKFKEASERAQIAAELSSDIEAYLVLIAAHRAQGQSAMAFEALRKARELAPEDPRLLNLSL